VRSSGDGNRGMPTARDYLHHVNDMSVGQLWWYIPYLFLRHSKWMLVSVYLAVCGDASAQLGLNAD
jgi:hypothetical protein